MKTVDPEKTVLIIGANQLQIELISFFLEKKFNMKSIVVRPQGISAGTIRNCELVLSDFEYIIPSDPLKVLNVVGEDVSFSVDMAVYNVMRNPWVVDGISKRDIRGIFFTGDTLGNFEDGLRTIFRGRTWFPEVRGKSVKKNLDEVFLGDPPLTRREKEVLRFMNHGLSNYEIAEKLDISPHTVKNHITNIYKKIDVANRLQACMWASRYLV